MTPPLAVGSEPRVHLALVVQPFLATVLAAVLFPLVNATGRPLYGGRPVDMLDSAGAFALGVGIVAAGIMLFGACPLLLWLLRRGPVMRRHAIVSGLVLGNVPTALAIVERALSGAGTTVIGGGLLDAVYGPAGAVRAIVFGSVMGITLALVFYRICGDRLAGAGR